MPKVSDPIGQDEHAPSPDPEALSPNSQVVDAPPFEEFNDRASIKVAADPLPLRRIIGRVSKSWQTNLPATDYPMPTTVCDAGSISVFWLAGASTAGSAHLHRASARQDAYAFAVEKKSGAVAVAVADGLGSQSLSQLGATWAAESVCRILRQAANRLIATPHQQAIGDALSAIVTASVTRVNKDLRQQRERDLPDRTDRDIATTLCAALLLPLHSEVAGAAVRIGDAAAWILDAGLFTPLFDAEASGPLNIVDGHLPSEAEPLAVVRPFILPLGGSVVLVTDGLDLDISSSSTVQEWLSSCWQERCDSLQMLNARSYRRQGSADDRTAVLVTYLGEAQDSREGA